MFRFITHEDDETNRRDWIQFQRLTPSAPLALPAASSNHAALEQPSSSAAAALSLSSFASLAAGGSHAQAGQDMHQHPPATSHVPAATSAQLPQLPASASSAGNTSAHQHAVLPKREADDSQTRTPAKKMKNEPVDKDKAKKMKKEPVDKDKAKELRATEQAMTKMIADLQCATSQASEMADSIKNNGKWKWLGNTPQFAAFESAVIRIDEAKSAFPVVKTLLTNGNKLGHRRTKRFNRAVALIEKHPLLYNIGMLAASNHPACGSETIVVIAQTSFARAHILQVILS